MRIESNIKPTPSNASILKPVANGKVFISLTAIAVDENIQDNCILVDLDKIQCIWQVYNMPQYLYTTVRMSDEARFNVVETPGMIRDIISELGNEKDRDTTRKENELYPEYKYAIQPGCIGSIRLTEPL